MRRKPYHPPGPDGAPTSPCEREKPRQPQHGTYCGVPGPTSARNLRTMNNLPLHNIPEAQLPIQGAAEKIHLVLAHHFRHMPGRWGIQFRFRFRFREGGEGERENSARQRDKGLGRRKRRIPWGETAGQLQSPRAQTWRSGNCGACATGARSCPYWRREVPTHPHPQRTASVSLPCCCKPRPKPLRV